MFDTAARAVYKIEIDHLDPGSNYSGIGDVRSVCLRSCFVVCGLLNLRKGE